MKKLLAVLTVVGVFALVPAAAQANKDHDGDHHADFVAQTFCVGGVTVTTDADFFGAVKAVAYNLAATHGGGYWTWKWENHKLVHDEFITVATGACPAASAWPVPPEPRRIAYCSVAGNTMPDGTPLVPGTFLNLLAGQPDTDAHYTGATTAFWVEGVGLTCSLTPAQAALASASTVHVGGGGEVFPADQGGFYTFIPKG